MKKALKNFGKTILVFVGLILLYLGSSFGLSRITVEREPNADDEMHIYILTNGVHTDIVVPVRNDQMDWSREIKYTNTETADSTYQYLGMGWGDKGFYLDTPTWAELKASVAFKAAFGLSTTAMHTTFHTALSESDSCKRIEISRKQYTKLIDYIKRSFQMDEDGHFIHIPTDANYGKADAFYEATGSYSMLHTCNTWANNGLKHSGQKSCLWTAFDTGIFSKYE